MPKHRIPLHILVFSHPDYTVGFGISPNPAKRLAGYTAGEEILPAPKTNAFICLKLIIAHPWENSKYFSL